MSDPAAPEETIFNVAHQLSDPQDRAAYLKDACGDDKAVRDRVERLLEAEQHANEFLARDPLGLEKEKNANQVNESACSGPDLGAASASMTTVAPAPGDVLEDYEIIEKIGGNMGLVFKARHRLLDKIVALKLLPADAITDPARLARFQRELRVMGQLEHPNLVTAADARVVGGWHMVSMEFIDGMDLERFVGAQGALPVADACEVARQAAVGLQYAHQHGLIHRDIKPSNLMLTHAGTIKVIDMGLAVIQEGSTGQLTQTGLVMGTMRYCAPEQFRDASRVDIRADIYSLGCTLYHLLTGKPPYSQRTTLAEVVQAHLNEPFPSLSQALPDAPAELGAVLARMTAKDPAARFAAPGEVAEALAPFARDGLGGYAPARTSRRKIPTTVAAGLLLLLGIGGLLLFTTCDGARGPTTNQAEGVAPNVAVYGDAKRTDLLSTNTVAQASIAAQTDDPRVVLMDTTAERGIYDKDNIGRGRFNFDELSEVLKDDLPRGLWREAVVEYRWERDETIVAWRPHLMVIHRSSFFHALAAEMHWGYPPFNTKAELEEFEARYDIADERLILLIGMVGTSVPHTHFVVYSRGTDKRWLKKEYRDQWVKNIERRFSQLKGRITLIVIPDGDKSTFRHPETRANMRSNVLEILGLPDKRQR